MLRESIGYPFALPSSACRMGGLPRRPFVSIYPDMSTHSKMFRGPNKFDLFVRVEGFGFTVDEAHATTPPLCFSLLFRQAGQSARTD